MTDIQSHRGPDDQGMRLFSLNSAKSIETNGVAGELYRGFEGAIGFNRLSILDLSLKGHQPMLNAEGNIMIAFNGEVYNAADHVDELKSAGFVFRSHTDTEVVLYLYEKHGLDGMLARLNGMFAIVIVDLRTQEVHVARDQFGIKPFYWAQCGHSILFASEAKSFLPHPAFRAEIDADHVDEYLAFRYVAGENYLLKGVQQLRPGHCLKITSQGVVLRCYWRIPDETRMDYSEKEALERVDMLLRSAVKSQLVSDVPVGCQLSGGIDSSLVSSYARTYFNANMHAFSVIFDDPRYSEERWIDEAAKAVKAESHRFLFTEDFFFDSVDSASWHLDQPLNHPNSLGIWLLAQESRKQVKVLLSGEGADEVFGGYPRFYYASLRPQMAPWMPILRHMPVLGARLERQFGGGEVDSFIRASLWQPSGQLLAARPEANLEPAMEGRRALFNEGHGDHLGNCLKYDMQTHMVDLLVRQDKMTMAHSMENRVPFLDLELVKLARGLPARSLVAQGLSLRNSRMRATKVVLKQLACREFNEKFVYRKKSGFSLPLSDYFSGERFRVLMEEALLPGMSARGLVSAPAVRRLWKGLPKLPAIMGEVLWIYVALELWARQFVDNSAPS